MSKQTTHKTWINGLALLLLAFGLSGCSTVEGIGKDVEKTGDAIEAAAKEARD